MKHKQTLAERVGTNIKAARNQRGLSQSQLAEKIGKLQSQISEWETGECEPQLATLIAIARILRVEVGTLLA